MIAIAHAAPVGRGDGGVAGRRAVIRWGARMFRREWRQQLLVAALLTIAVAAAVGSIATVYNTSPADNAEFGSANYLLRFDGTRPRELDAGLAATKKWFGTTEVIGHRSVPVPGTVEAVDFRAQDPAGVFGHNLLALRQGSYPAGPHQAAVTDGVARLLGLKIGSTLALDGRRRTVVGIVENSRKLNDEFALVSPSSAGAPDQVTVLVDASAGSIDSFRHSLGERSAFFGSEARPHRQAANALAMFSIATVFLLLASLVASAGFAVVAQRRLRQLGMLAAVGATRKHLRLVLLTNGSVVGAIGAIAGTILGLGLWIAFAPTLESAVGHRVDRLSLPWSLIAATGLLAILGATAAAWWPGRAAARLPVMLALSGRPPKPRPARHAAIASAALIAIGIASLAFSERHRPPLIILGIVATIFGCLLLGPPAIRVFSRVAGSLSVAPRLALRDLVRYQARSGAALAAVALALGITATVVVVVSAEAAKRSAEPTNLSNRQIRVYLGPPQARELIPSRALGQLARLDTSIQQIAGGLDHASVMPLRKAIQPGARPFFESSSGLRVRPTIELMKQVGRRTFTLEAQLYVATPAVLRYLGIDPATIDPGTDFLVDRGMSTNQFVFPSFTSRRLFAVTKVQRVRIRGHLLGSAMGLPAERVAFVTLSGLRRRGWKEIPAGWLVQSSRPLTGEQIAKSRDIAAQAGLAIEVQSGRTSLAKPMAIATAAGALLALGILAMTVGLIRAESAGDLRTLTAAGATSGIRRKLTAATAGALALLGAVLGVAGAYVALLATYHDDLGYLSHVPLLYLGLTVLGVPLAAAAAGWLLAGREPSAIARTVIA